MRQSHAYDIVGVIQPVNLGTGSDGSGTHFLADDKTYKTVSAGTATNTRSEIVAVTAVDTLNPYIAVTITGRIADSANSGHYGKVLGLNQATTINAGFSGDILVSGLITNGAWSWTPGVQIFLNGTNLSATPPSTGYVQRIGAAKASDTIYVDLDIPFLL